MVIALVGGTFAKFRIKRPKDTDSECLFPRRAEAQVVCAVPTCQGCTGCGAAELAGAGAALLGTAVPRVQWQGWHSPSLALCPCPTPPHQIHHIWVDQTGNSWKLQEPPWNQCGCWVIMSCRGRPGNSLDHFFRSGDNVSFPSQEHESGCSAQFARKRAAPWTASKCLLLEKNQAFMLASAEEFFAG